LEPEEKKTIKEVDVRNPAARKKGGLRRWRGHGEKKIVSPSDGN